MQKGMVSVVVLNWNGKDVIADCLDSLLAQDYESREIIVVDNDSRDGSLEMIESKYGLKIMIMRNARNFGFAGGCNVGIRMARGEYVALLNSDAVADPNWMTEMVRAIEKDGKCGMVAGKIYFKGDGKLIENTGHIIFRDGLGRGRGRLEVDEGQYDAEETIFCPNGCAALYRKKMLDEIGMFDELFFAYADDIDVGFRGRLLGYECRYTPKAVAHHCLSESFGMLSPLKAFLVERNRMWVIIKCFPIRALLLAPCYTFARYAYTLYGLLRGKGPAAQYVEKISLLNLAAVAFKAYLSTLWHLPYLLMQRFKVRGQTRTDKKDFDAWMRDYGMSAKEAALNEISH